MTEGENGYQVLETKSVNPFAVCNRIRKRQIQLLNAGLTEQLILQTQMKSLQQALMLIPPLPLTLITMEAEAAVAAEAVGTRAPQAAAAVILPEALA